MSAGRAAALRTVLEAAGTERRHAGERTKKRSDPSVFHAEMSEYGNFCYICIEKLRKECNLLEMSVG